jgi:cytochrome P450
MHHSEKIYGKDAKVFRPERWFESDPAKLNDMVRTNELIFGYGKYRCLGKTVADIEIGKLIFEVRYRPSSWKLGSA